MGCSLSVKVNPEHLRSVEAHPPPTWCDTRVVRKTLADAATSPMLSAVMRGRGRKTSAVQSHNVKDKYALVIGIDDYLHWDVLDCPVGDANAVGNWFQSHGFAVHTLLNKQATFANIVRALVAIPACGTAVVSLHGHGAKGATTSSFVPANACADPNDISDKISAAFVQNWSQQWAGDRALVIADCCFGGNFVLPPRVKMRGYRASQQERVRMTISASTMDEMVPDKQQGCSNSPLVHCVLRVLRSGTWSGSVLDLFVAVRRMSPEGCTPKMGRLPGDEGGDIWLK